jgi:hypothetical protein
MSAGALRWAHGLRAYATWGPALNYRLCSMKVTFVGGRTRTNTNPYAAYIDFSLASAGPQRWTTAVRRVEWTYRPIRPAEHDGRDCLHPYFSMDPSWRVRPFGDLGRIDISELGPLDPLTDGWTVVAAPPRGSGTRMCRAEVLVVPRRPLSVKAFRRPIVSRDPGGHGLSGPGRYFSGVALGARR